MAEPTHELSPATLAALDNALGDALDLGVSLNDKIIAAIEPVIIQIDANADQRGYERARGEYQQFKPGGPVRSPVEFDPTYLTVAIGDEQIVKVRL